MRPHPDGTADPTPVPSEPAAQPAPTTLPVQRRVVSVVAATSLFAGLVLPTLVVEPFSAAQDLVLMVGYIAVLAEVVAALVVRTRQALRRLDWAVLGTAVVLFAVEHLALVLRGHSLLDDDVAYLGHDAVRALVRGHNPYTHHFHNLLVLQHGLTRMFGGGIVTRYEYPPLTPEIGWALHHVSPRLGEPYILSAVGLLATAVVVFLTLPTSVRVLAVPLVLGLGLYEGFADKGFPVLVALPLLCFAVWRWTAIGSTGRLGRIGVLQAVALGLACTAQQLAWCLAVFLAVAMWTIRSGELGRRRAAVVLARFFGVALLVFLVLDAPFIVTAPRAWFSGITAVFTQHADPFGVGLIRIVLSGTGNSGALGYFGYATLALALGLLAVTAVGVRRVAAAVPVFVAVVFLLSARSASEYVVAFVPLWLVWVAHTEPRAVAQAAPLRLRRLAVLPGPIGQGIGVLLAVAPALVLTGVAILTPAPLSIVPRSAVLAGARVQRLVLDVRNVSSSPMRAVFFVNERGSLRTGWTVVHGPRSLAPGTQATYVLQPSGAATVPPAHPFVYATSPGVDALSSAPVRLAPGDITDTSRLGRDRPIARAARRCTIELLGGATSCNESARASV